MKSDFRMLLIFIMILFSVSCSANKDTTGLLIYREDDLFMTGLTADIQEGSQGILQLETMYSRNSQVIQNEQIETMLESGASLMIVNPVDRLGAHAILNKLKAADVPVIFFNREPLKKDIALWENAWYVGALAEQSGRIQAELAMELFGSSPYRLNRHDLNSDGKIQTVILKGEQGHQDAEIRTETVQKAFAEAGYYLDVLAIEIANWNRNEAYEKTGELLESLNQVPELILSNNDAMALGAISIMRQRGFFHDANGNGIVDRDDSDWIPVLGIDGVPDAVAMIKDGYLYGTVINDSLGMAEAIIDLAKDLREGTVRSPENPEDRYIWVDYRTFRLD